jgi:solute:Na+ symporter, SSS family
MHERTLNTAQVATLLLSASCGMGFLLGTGELALHEGMAGCLYTVATATGLVLLGLCAPALWSSGESIWNRFASLYGSSVRHGIALLSLIWMTGTLATQIRGGSVVLAMIGMPGSVALPLVCSLLIGFSFIRLPWLSAGLAFCMLGSAALLTHVLVKTAELGIWLDAPILFVRALPHDAFCQVGFTVATVAAMVVWGADYQQFVLAADNPAAARTGCLLAAILVFIVGFLPASAVIAARSLWHLSNTTDSATVVPMVLAHSVAGSVASSLVTSTLIAAALGSACAILRAMIDALTTVGPILIRGPLRARLLTVGLSALVASRSQSLVDTMVELSMVYLAAISPILVFRLLRIRTSDKTANASMAAGAAVALSCYLLRWAGMVTLPQASALCLAIPVALGFAGAVHYYTVAWHCGNGGREEQGSRERSVTDGHLTRLATQELIAPNSGERDTSPFR